MNLKQTQEEELKKFENKFGRTASVPFLKEFLLSAMEAAAKGAIEGVIGSLEESPHHKAHCACLEVNKSQLKQRWLGEKI